MTLLIINYLNDRFKENWMLSPNLSIDETMCPFKGKFKFLQYIFGKPHSTGIKSQGLADEHSYLWHIWPYLSGKHPKPYDIVMNFHALLCKWGFNENAIWGDMKLVWK